MSTPRGLIVVGGGEHARVVIEAARSRPDLWKLLGFVDPLPRAETRERLGVLHLGDDGHGLALADGDVFFVLGVGSVGVTPAREEVVARYAAPPAQWATVVHERAWVSPTAALEPGVVVSAGAVVNSGAQLGRHVVVNTGAVVEHDVVLGEYVQVGPGAVIGGGTRVGRGSYLGLGSRVRDHVNLGRDVMVAMGAVVVRPLADGEVVWGVPARPRRSGSGV